MSIHFSAEQKKFLGFMGVPESSEGMTPGQRRNHLKVARMVLRFSEAREDFQTRLRSGSSSELKAERLEKVKLYVGMPWLGSMVEFDWFNQDDQEIRMMVGPRSDFKNETFSATLEPDKLRIYHTWSSNKGDVPASIYDPATLLVVSEDQPHILHNAIKLSEHAAYLARKLA